jgi:hypothetical protein
MKAVKSVKQAAPSGVGALLDLNSPRALAFARVSIPLLFGFYSMLLGADTNWDLLNYHLYNPFAWLNGRLQTDLAPAGMQSYFNPLLDLPFYWMTLHLPPRLTAFAMGVVHGLNFLLLLGVAQRVCGGAVERQPNRLPLLLAMAGILMPCFLSQIGNTMGDNATSLLVLGGLLLLLNYWDRMRGVGAQAWLPPAAAGFLVGMAVGLKPTSACYAVAMCTALLSFPERMWSRLRVAFLFGVGVLVGWAMTGGYWMWHMWQIFGNPLYPQFGQFFHNPLTQPIGSGDVRFLPHGLLQTLVWPFIMGASPNRVAGLSRELVWPVVYVVILCALAATVIRQRRGTERRALDKRARFVVLFVALGYLVWMKVFSIYRYLVPVEMLAPIVVFSLLTLWQGPQSGTRAARWLIGAMVATGVIGGLKTWGHDGWTDPLYRVDVPTIAAPEHATVMLYSASSARGWMVPFLPPQIAFAGVGSSFPATAAYYDRLRAMIVARGGQAYAVIDGADNWRARSVARTDQLLGKLGLTNSESNCDKLKSVVHRLHLHASVTDLASGPKKCRLAVRSDDAQQAIMVDNHQMDLAAQAVQQAGMTLDRESCKPYSASIGSSLMEYRFCRVELR